MYIYIHIYIYIHTYLYIVLLNSQEGYTERKVVSLNHRHGKGLTLYSGRKRCVDERVVVRRVELNRKRG